MKTNRQAEMAAEVASWKTGTLVDRGVELRAAMAGLAAELKAIEGELQARGLKGPQVDLVDEEREGKRWLAEGSGVVVPVVFTADRLMQSFRRGSPAHSTVRAIAGDMFKEFWALKEVYETRVEGGKKFRRLAGELLGAKGPAFVTACLARDKFGVPRSDVRVEWPQDA